ncbi:unnamed protein product [Diabrotica balteata]|uniref:Uncharacterized protein n=1 Tax=Diabrotica balteata TaxID=107213 RepID=A0A9N9SYM4_DIABA|nr:unnamed protein product [Diabrotica balteata]
MADGKVDEDSKRKSKEELDIFSRSRKVNRTPDRSNPSTNEASSNNEMMELMRQLVSDNKKKNKDLEDIKNTMGNMTEELKEIRKENSEYKLQMKEIIRENENLKQEMATMKQKIDKIEITLEACQKEKKKITIMKAYQ